MARQTHGQPEQATKRTYVEVDGIPVHYVRAGTGPALLLIHGLTGSVTNWRRNVEFLARSATVYAIDLINMGDSGRVRGLDASLAATADRVAACMDALGLATADIAGHSHGGAIAMMLAARHPHRARSLVLFAPANPYCTAGHGLIRLYSSAPGRLLARTLPYLPNWIFAISLGRMYGDPARVVDGTLAGYTDGMRIPGSISHVLAIVRGWHADMAELQSSLPDLAQVPALLVWGDRDRAVHLASAHRLQRHLDRSELVVVRTAGHVAFEEMPEEANRIVAAWLGRNRSPGCDPKYAGQARPQRLPQQTSIRAPLSATPQHV